MISRSRASKAELLLRGMNSLSSAGKHNPWQTRSQDMKEISNELSKDSQSADQSMGKRADETSVQDGGRIQEGVVSRKLLPAVQGKGANRSHSPRSDLKKPSNCSYFATGSSLRDTTPTSKAILVAKSKTPSQIACFITCFKGEVRVCSGASPRSQLVSCTTLIAVAMAT
jgi:hypothetical protein